MYELSNSYFHCDECPVCNGMTGYDPKFEHYSCYKTGGLLGDAGCCEDAFDQKAPTNHKGGRNTGRAYRRKMSALKKKERMKRSSYSGYLSGHPNWGYVNGVYDEIGTYLQYPRDSEVKGYLKKLSNRTVRRCKDLPSGRCGYRKCFDLWWALY